MNNGADIDYIQIDHKNSFAFSENIVRKIQFHENISVIGPGNEINITNEMNKLFDYIISSSNKGKKKTNYDMSIILSTDYMNENKFFIIPALTLAMNNILNNNYTDQEFVFNNQNIDDLSTVLFYSFWRINSYSKNYFHIDSQADFYNAIFDVNYQNINVIPTFINPLTKMKSYADNNVKKRKDSEDIGKMKRRDSRGQYRELFRSFQESDHQTENKQKNDAFEYSYSEVEKYPLPIEILVLINKFQTIKRLNFSIEVMCTEQVSKCLLILFNTKWLFPNVLEIEFDLVSQKITNYLDAYYLEKLTSSLNQIDKFVKTTRYDSIDRPVCSWEPLVNKSTLSTSEIDSSINSTTVFRALSEFNASMIENNSRCRDIVKENEAKLDMSIIYSYFISQMEQIKVLMMRFYDPFTGEIEKSLSNKKINLNTNSDSSFLNLILFMKTLAQLTVEFNALDINYFQKVIAIINGNNSLRGIRLSLFATEEYYSPSRLYKLYCNLKLDISALFKEKSALALANNLNDDIDFIIIRKLLASFSNNLDCFLYVLQNARQLTEIYLNMDLPNIITGDECYTMVLLKFLFNLLIYLSYEKHSFQSVKVISPLLPFDGRKCPLINQFLDNLEFSKGDHKVKRLTIQLKFYSVVNVTKLIPKGLTWLFLGDLDFETFRAFIEFYSSGFTKQSQLISLSISLSSVLTAYSSIKTEILNLYRYYPQSLAEFLLYSNLKVTYTDMNEIYFLINYNSVSKYFFSLCENSLREIDKYPHPYLSTTTQNTRVKLKLLFLILKKSNITKASSKTPLEVLRNLLSESKEIEFDDEKGSN